MIYLIDQNENLYAFNVKGDIIFAPDAESGQKGYFCLGCNRLMQAIKPIKGKFFPYFRHDSKASKGLPNCTYRDETFRHKLAIDILQIEKQIKVPDVLKYPPTGIDSPPNLLVESHYIIAESAQIELTFYEDDNCVIRWGKSENIDRKNLLIRPDVSFFDIQGKPILLIEIVATHKIDDEKYLKLQRLGIDTIQVIIPKISIEEIRKFNKKIKYSKWIYNHVEQEREYIQVSPSNAERILSADELPEYFFKESFKCRAAQIRDLMRRISICLESEQFRSVKQHLESEIQRVKNSTKRIKSEQEDHRRISRENLESRNSVELEEISREATRLRKVGREFKEKSESLDARYTSKRGKIKDEQRKVDDESNKLFSPSEQSRLNIEGRKFENERIKDEISKDIQRERDVMRNLSRRKEELPIEFKRNKAGERQDFESIRKQFEDEQESVNKRRDGISKRRREFEEEVGREFETRRGELVEKMDSGKFDRSELISRSNNPVIQGWKLLNDFKDSEAKRKRARAAYECFKKGDFKNWEK
jgi:hypothetical protein